MSTNNYSQLSEQERCAIALALQQGMSLRAISRALGRSPSTISRECQRNGGANAYVCRFAQQRCDRRRRNARPKPKLQREGELFKSVHAHLLQWWSPQQIARELRLLHPDNKPSRVPRDDLHLYLCPATW